MAETFDPYHKWLGISPRDQPPHHYRLLGVELFESDPDVIENAADQRMAHVRSFQHGARSQLSQQLLNEIAAAKLVLLDPEEKKKYDAELAHKLQPPAASAKAPRPVPVARPLSVAPSSSTTAPSTAASPVVVHTSKSVPSKRKDPAIEVAKIVAGGIAGVAIAYVLLGFLRPDWDHLGIARSVLGRNSDAPASSADSNANDLAPETPPADADVAGPPAAREQQALAVKPPPLPIQTAQFGWQWDKPTRIAGPSETNFLLLASVGGHFLGDGEWFTMNIDDQQQWTVGGGAVKHIGTAFTVVDSPCRRLFEPEVEEFEWKKDSGPIQLIHKNDGFAVLSGVHGCFLGKGEMVRVYLAEDDHWYLEGKSAHKTRGRARVYRYRQPGQFQAEVKEYIATDQTPRVELLDPQEGLCYLSAMGGGFHGWGEIIYCQIDEQTGRWYFDVDAKQPSTVAHCIELRFSDEVLDAARRLPPLPSAAPPKVPNPPDALAQQETVGKEVEVPEPMPAADVGKQQPPAEETVTQARENLGALKDESGPDKLLAAAREERPAAERYALYLAARDAAVAAANPNVALKVVDALADAFEIDRFAFTTETLVALRETCQEPPACRQLAAAALKHLDEAPAGDKETVQMLAELALAASRKSDDNELMRRATLKWLEARE